MKKKSLLWVGDAVCASGFAKATHKILETVKEHYDVTVLGLNSLGTPHSYPYEIWPAMAGGDMFGANELPRLIRRIKPQVIVIQNDPWNIPDYMSIIKRETACPVIGALAVDGSNVQGPMLKDLDHAIFWTKFAQDEAVRGQFRGTSSVIPLGVDLDMYSPFDKIEARTQLGLRATRGQETGKVDLSEAFIIGNVNRNQPRKRLDLLVSYFAQWISDFNIKDAYLYLHVAPTGEDAFDLGQLMAYYGYSGRHMRLLECNPEVFFGRPESEMKITYSAFDVMMTTTQGEGWGLTTMEGMACGVPQIVPNWSALGEWAKNYTACIPCSEIAVTPTHQKMAGRRHHINIIGGVMDRTYAIKTLQSMYEDRNLLATLGQQALECVEQPQYRWENIGAAYVEVLDTLTAKYVPVKVTGSRAMHLSEA